MLLQLSCPIYEETTNKTLSKGCQLHVQKVKSRLDYIGRHQFVLTFTICPNSGEKMAISVSSASCGLVQLT